MWLPPAGTSPGGSRRPGAELGGGSGAVKQQHWLLVGMGENVVSTGLHRSDCGSQGNTAESCLAAGMLLGLDVIPPET